MASQIQNLLDNVIGDGARSAKFELSIQLPFTDYFPENLDIQTMVKSSSYPGKSIDTIDVKYKGRSIPVKGQVKYNQTWDCTFYLTEDHKLKNAFEVWIEAMNNENYISFDSDVNYKKQQQKVLKKYTSEILISQLNFELDENRIDYFLQNAFPISVSQVETSYDAVGQISEFTVTFSYSHYISIPYKETKSAVQAMLDEGKKELQNAVDNVKKEIVSSISDTSGKIGNYFSNTSSTDEIYKQERGMMDGEL